MDFALGKQKISKPKRNFNLNNCLKTSLNWLFVEKCLVCQQQLVNHDYPCCNKCQANLLFQSNTCRRCGRTLSSDFDYCGHCLQRPPNFDACFCAFQYQSPMDEWIRKFKYGERIELAKPLAKMLAVDITEHDIALPELLIPVPMHRQKLRTRGFNQAQLLARHLSRCLQIPYSQSHIIKHKTTKPQANLSFKHRSKNIRGSFTLNKPIKAKHIAIIDDVVTTGATVSEIARVLHSVPHIQVWGIAHTI